uniref:Uncharacterized protein n=1 Tax=Acrobeloides nanus TaxID=290746 RepID=A0A914C9K9_9BILA
MWSWTTEIFILAGFQIFAYFISMPFSSSKQKPLMIVTIFAGFLAISLQVLPSGIFYNLLLQISKFVTLLLDHFVLFFVLNFCLPSLKTPVSDAPPSASAATATFRTAKTHPNTLESARLRAKLLAVAEGFACFSRTLGVFFVLEIPFFFFTPTEDVGKPNSTVGQPPKMLLCAICYATELMVLIVGNAICCKWPSNLQPPRLSTDDKNRPILRLEAGNRYRTPRPQQP